MDENIETKITETKPAEVKKVMEENIETKTTETKHAEVKKVTALGIDENLEGALCYFLGFLTGVLFLILEKDNKFIRFHAMQSIALFIPLFMIGFILSFTFVLLVLVPLLWLLEFALWIFMMYKAYNKEMYKLPIVGDFAAKQVGV